ncbi:lytic transglycosylase domain-containing protein [Mycobacterium sp. DL440]|uniref:lytic transglycosylase domain-containing protein n=1 Tax=Mycobacterium sp. DL440 TaxID=2675523 RepID=UPI0014221D9B|nr:lytic transglycosylase domain-containing protein [Mycobacterium sp. DL440]
MARFLHSLAILFTLGAVLSGCSGSSDTSGLGTQTTTPRPPTTTPASPAGKQPRLAADPGRLAEDLIADERALRSPATPEPALTQAARRQQVAYRTIGRHPEWDGMIRPRIPAELVGFYDRNVAARRQLAVLAHPKDTLPAWRINPPPSIDLLLDAYREAEAASGVGWNYLAAINLIETHFGSVTGDSSAGAQGPMQFMPSTFAAYGRGGDIQSPRDSIMAAGNYLAANGFARDPDYALFRYNNADEYVRAVTDYAAAMAADPAAFGAFYRWDVYYVSTAGDVLLPIGYAAESRIPVGEYLTAHPQ